jgi:hypothetical protein
LITDDERVKYEPLIQLGKEIPLVMFTLSLELRVNTNLSQNKTPK